MSFKLRQSFFSATEKEELYLNLVLEYIPETVYRVSKNYNRANQHMPMIYVQLYIYQICRALNYIHNVIGVCHRDIKPQNLLVNPRTHELKCVILAVQRCWWLGSLTYHTYALDIIGLRN
ncbi:unnamed protein product [Rhodiola kirilowii]